MHARSDKSLSVSCQQQGPSQPLTLNAGGELASSRRLVPRAYGPCGGFGALPERRAGTKSVGWLEALDPLVWGPDGPRGGLGPSCGVQTAHVEVEVQDLPMEARTHGGSP
jgi:hypothetical protein